MNQKMYHGASPWHATVDAAAFDTWEKDVPTVVTDALLARAVTGRERTLQETKEMVATSDEARALQRPAD